MLRKIVHWVISLSPNIRKRVLKNWYELFNHYLHKQNYPFLNYGYCDNNPPIELSVNDEEFRYSIQLYNQLLSKIDLREKHILEIGSGRGGGANFINQYFDHAGYTGIDISKKAITISNKLYKSDNVNFIWGDAEDLQFENCLFEVILNVESSHCYSSMDQFLSEVHRVLLPSGYFLFCDLREEHQVENFLNSLEKSNFELVEMKDISKHIISGLEKMSDDRISFINQNIPRVFRKSIESYSGVHEGDIFNSFLNGTRKYYSGVLSKA